MIASAVFASTAMAQTLGCTCINPIYPCYAWYPASNRLTCWNANEASCANMCRDGSSPCSPSMSGGEFCRHAACTIAHCSACNPEGSICTTCESGWMVTSPPSGSCQSEASFFADVSVQLLPGSGVVAVISANLAGLLTDGFNSGSRGTAVRYVAQAVTRVLEDRFTLVYVYPAAELTGATHQQYWGARGVGGTSTLQGVISGGNAASGGYKAVIHELTHNYVSPYTLLPSNYFGSHWGFTAFAEPHAGELGGYAHGAFTCASPSGRVPSSASPCATDQIVVDTSAGSLSTSNDLSPDRYPNAELYIMGCASLCAPLSQLPHSFLTTRPHFDPLGQADDGRRPSRSRR